MEQYLVQVFERTYYGKECLEERVVNGDQGVRDMLAEHTFVDHVIDDVIKFREYHNDYDIIYVKPKNEDGSFDYYD